MVNHVLAYVLTLVNHVLACALMIWSLIHLYRPGKEQTEA